MGNAARLETKWYHSMGREKLLPSSSCCPLVTDREKQCANCKTRSSETAPSCPWGLGKVGTGTLHLCSTASAVCFQSSALSSAPRLGEGQQRRSHPVKASNLSLPQLDCPMLLTWCGTQGGEGSCRDSPCCPKEGSLFSRSCGHPSHLPALCALSSLFGTQSCSPLECSALGLNLCLLCPSLGMGGAEKPPLCSSDWREGLVVSQMLVKTQVKMPLNSWIRALH